MSPLEFMRCPRRPNFDPPSQQPLTPGTFGLPEEQRRKTRLRPVHSRPQASLFGDAANPQGIVSDLEVRKVLDTVAAEG